MQKEEQFNFEYFAVLFQKQCQDNQAHEEKNHKPEHHRN